MARKRRKGGKRRARRASPKRRRRSYSRRPIRRRRRRSKRGPFAARVRRGTRVIYINGRRGRRGRRRVRRNPGFMGTLKRVFTPYAVGFVTSAVFAVVDSKVGKPVTRNVIKLGGAIAIAFLGRRYPTASTAAIAAIGASQGYEVGTKVVGGMLARNPAEVPKAMSEMAETYPEMGALLAGGGMGALLAGPDNLDASVMNYMTAVNNIADDE